MAAGQLAHLLGSMLASRMSSARRPGGRKPRARSAAGRHFGSLSRPGAPAEAGRRRPISRGRRVRWAGASTGSSAAVRQIQAQTVAQERPDRVLHEPHQVVELEDRLVQRGKRGGQPGTGGVCLAGGPRARRGGRGRSSTVRRRADAGAEVSASNGCSGWSTTTCWPAGLRRRRRRRSRSTTSSSSATGTAGGRTRLVRSSRPL